MFEGFQAGGVPGGQLMTTTEVRARSGIKYTLRSSTNNSTT